MKARPFLLILINTRLMHSNSPIVALVDYDKIFQITSSRTNQATQLNDKVRPFENGGEALDFIRNNLSNASRLPDYTFLDINMPYVDGWMFLDDYDQLKSNLPKPISIYMLSSSIDPRDIKRAKSNGNVTDY